MRAVIQRVGKAGVTINGKLKASIGKGLLVLLGIEGDDTSEDTIWLCGKIIRLRVFDDPGGIMNLSLREAGGELLIVSQFTLHASTKKGNRPSYIRAAQPDKAIPLYEQFIREMSLHLGDAVKTGTFGAMMDVSLVNEGPVTIIIDSKTRE